MRIDFKRLVATLVPSERPSQGGVEPDRGAPRAGRSRHGDARRGIAIALLVLACPGCARREVAPAPDARLPLRVIADTTATVTLDVPPAAAARAWLERVSIARPARIAPSDLSSLPAPSPPPETRAEAVVPRESLVVDDDLHPPIPIAAAAIRLPSSRARARVVELDVRIDEEGMVSDALWSGGSADSAAVRAATDCALAMRFHPALRRGRPVAVWCRQRFEFDRSGARPADAEGGVTP